MKSTAIAWATCVLLLLGQLIFFYAVVSPQLQKKPDLPQYVTEFCEDNTASSGLDVYIRNLQAQDDQGHANNHVDAMTSVPTQNGVCVIVVYSSSSQ